MLTETIPMSPISTNRPTHWDHLKYYPCTVDHTQLLPALSFVCFLRSATLAFVSCLVFPILPDQLQEKPSHRKIISPPSAPWAHCETSGFFRDSRLTVVNFPSTDWLSYLRTQLKAFVGGVCLQSRRFFLALFSRINFFTWSRHLRVITQREFVQLPSNLDSS